MGLPFSLETLETFSPDEEIVLEDVQVQQAGVKRSQAENIEQSKVVILSDQDQEPLVTFNLPTATDSHPRLENNPGLYSFSVSFSQLDDRVKLALKTMSDSTVPGVVDCVVDKGPCDVTGNWIKEHAV